MAATRTAARVGVVAERVARLRRRQRTTASRLAAERKETEERGSGHARVHDRVRTGGRLGELSEIIGQDRDGCVSDRETDVDAPPLRVRMRR